LAYSAVFQLKGKDSFDIHVDSWSCTVRFKSDSNAPRYSGAYENNRLYIDMYNHNNSLGDTIGEPFRIASAGDVHFYMTYTVSLLNDEQNVRRVEYALWVDE